MSDARITAQMNICLHIWTHHGYYLMEHIILGYANVNWLDCATAHCDIRPRLPAACLLA